MELIKLPEKKYAKNAKEKNSAEIICKYNLVYLWNWIRRIFFHLFWQQ